MTGLRPLSAIKRIVIHCADTPNGDPRYNATDIDRWHAENGWYRVPGMGPHQPQHIGYHYVIEVDGNVAPGRTLEEVGAHCRGANADSIGICMVGQDAFTLAQWAHLRGLVEGTWIKAGKGLTVHGHRDLLRPGDKPKTCPGFDVQAWLAGGMAPLDGHVCEPKENPDG
jgi:hypothetical protein